MAERPLSRWLVLLLLVLLMAVSAAEPGKAAEGFRLIGLGGGELSRAELESGTVVVVVWASWSPRGREIPAQVGELVREWGERARILTVNYSEERSVVEEFLRGREMPAPVYLDSDGQFGRAYGVTSLPAPLVLRDGKTLYSGRWPGDPDALLSEILK